MRNLAILAVVALLVGLGGGVAQADTLAIDFEAPVYAPGSIQGQDGWAACTTLVINPLIDQAIVTNGVGAPVSFGAQSWRFSNAYTNGSFGDWPCSPSLADEAGETAAANDGLSNGTRQRYFVAEWDFASAAPAAEQAGLQMSMAPDRGDGARMSFIKMRDAAGGLEVDFADYQSGLNEPGCVFGSNFVTTTVATGLDRSAPHTIRMTMQFVDGPNNDVVKVYVDGALKHTGTSWEGYFNECEENPTRTVDSLIFQARGTHCGDVLFPDDCVPANAGKGFLLDNVTIHSGTGAPLSTEECKNGGWQTLTRDDGSSFKNQGDCIQYFNTGK